MKKVESYKHVLLDFDGTICNLIVDWKSLKSELISSLPKRVIGENSKLLNIVNAVYDVGSSNDIVDLHRIIKKYEQPNDDVVFEKVNSYLLNSISSFIVVSNNLKSTIEKAFEKIEKESVCQKIIGVDNVKNTKPSISAFDEVVAFTNNSNLSDYLFVGDSEIDEQFAFNCGIDFIHINNYEDYSKSANEA
jgi:phosphoglycolate phosphatase-like HAD superfamily hydrolase